MVRRNVDTRPLTLAEQLEAAGLSVVGPARPGRGNTDGVAGVEVIATGVSKERPAADHLTQVVDPNRGTVFVEANGRVWVLADGPIGTDMASVWVGAGRIDAVDDEIVATVVAVLSGHYGTAEPVPAVSGETSGEPEPSEPTEGS